MNTILETTGYIAKEEFLSTVTENILPNTLVLENNEPYPGYHGENPQKDKMAEYIFICTKKHLNFVDTSRLYNKLKKYCSEKIDLASGELNIYNKKYYCIRVKNLTEYGKIKEMQECLTDEEIKFTKYEKIDTTSIIKVVKTFHIEQLDEFIYQDLENKKMFYIVIDKYVKWKKFEIATKNLKFNIANRNFDAAIGAFFRKDGIKEMIRIYSEKETADSLNELRNQYLKEIDRLS